MKPRKLTLEQAKARFPHRFTMEHCPSWALKPKDDGKFYAPQYRTDREWYENTAFPGELEHPLGKQHKGHAYSANPTWPLGQSLDHPFNVKLSQELATHFQQQLQSAR